MNTLDDKLIDIKSRLDQLGIEKIKAIVERIDSLQAEGVTVGEYFHAFNNQFDLESNLKKATSEHESSDLFVISKIFMNEKRKPRNTLSLTEKPKSAQASTKKAVK